MTIKDIARLRLANQQISAHKTSTVKELVGFMGALQAQDYPMVKWAAGLRLKNSDEQLINSALDKGEILRTHLLRPTWHLVSSDDILWMLELTGPGINDSMKSRNRQLGLTREIFSKSNDIIRNALEGKHLTREELIECLEQAKIDTKENRASHLLAAAELEGIICSGKPRGNKITYALLAERAKSGRQLSRDESLSELAETYFRSRGPATIYDFSWWSGLTIGDCRRAIDMIKNKIKSFEADSQIFWHLKSSPDLSGVPDEVYLLPTYDEFIIGYRDRSAVLLSDSHKRIISSNGIFRSIIVYKGSVIGTWKRTLKNDSLSMEFIYFNDPSKKIQKLAENKSEIYAKFLGKKLSFE